MYAVRTAACLFCDGQIVIKQKLAVSWQRQQCINWEWQIVWSTPAALGIPRLFLIGVLPLTSSHSFPSSSTLVYMYLLNTSETLYECMCKHRQTDRQTDREITDTSSCLHKLPRNSSVNKRLPQINIGFQKLLSIHNPTHQCSQSIRHLSITRCCQYGIS